MSARAVLFGGRLDGLERIVPLGRLDGLERIVPLGPDGLPHPLLLAPGEPLLTLDRASTKTVSILRYRRVRLVLVLAGEELWRYELDSTTTTSEEDSDHAR